jgi:hypothetical protein
MRLADLNLNKATPLDRRSSSSEAGSNLNTLYGATASGLYRSGRDGPKSTIRNQSFVIIPPAKKFELVTKVGTAALSRPRYLQDAADA